MESNKKSNTIKSPLRYTGNKHKLLPQLLPLFPQDVDTFFDAFCGGLSVTLNATAKRYVANDIDANLIALYKEMKDSTDFVSAVSNVLSSYGLGDGLNNVDGYAALRANYNANKDPVEFFALITQAYNSLILYTQDGTFNTCYSHGDNDFGVVRRENVKNTCSRLAAMDIEFMCGPYTEIAPTNKDFVYCDPPYLITLAGYNKGNGWNRVNEYELLNWLDTLDTMGIKFGLSNVLRHKGRSNIILLNWCSKYRVVPLVKKYGSLAKARSAGYGTEEVFICNY